MTRRPMRSHGFQGLRGTEHRQPCGTRAAYVRHLRHREVPCAKCTNANREYGQRMGQQCATTTTPPIGTASAVSPVGGTVPEPDRSQK